MEALTNPLDLMVKGKWQWKSNLDAWSQTEEPTWETYSLDQNYLIEKAYYDQQKEVDLGDHLVYPLDLLQIKKGDPQAQRPIRRVDWMGDEEMNDRSERYFESELPKTLNMIFGSLGDFLSFFGRRNPEILEFQNEFNRFEESKDLDVLKNEIIPQLISCLEKELLNPISNQLKDPSLTKFAKQLLLSKKKRSEGLIELFRKDFSSVEEFYGEILKSYTMNTSLYANLNKYLRNESWVEVDNLLPYIFCLCKTFFNTKSNSSQKQNSILLYRGTALNEAALKLYEMRKNGLFSWYCVTSTTRDSEIAKKFMFRSANIEEKKSPVMFIIEIPIPEDSDKSEQLKWINVSKYSAIPTEDEVILAPGSVFELVDISTDQDKSTTTIKLKLKGEVQSLAHGGMMMPGALQNQMMTEKGAKIMCLDGEELSQALMSLRGNKLIEGVEFCLCTFNKKSLSFMFEILPTLGKAKSLKFIACKYEAKGQITIEGERCTITKIEVAGGSNFFQMICNEKQNQEYWVSLRELDLDFTSRQNLEDEELNAAVSQGLKHLPQLTSLNINCKKCRQITDNGVNNLAQTFSSLVQLTNLNLSFQSCEKITDKGVNGLAKGLNSLTQLADFTLNFRKCENITEEGVNSLAKALNFLTQLTHFNFYFHQWEKTNDKEVNSVAKLLSSLTQLMHLNIDINCIADEGMNILAKGLGSLPKLTDLNFCFQSCEQMTDDGVKSFARGFSSLTQMTHLNIKFAAGEQITDSGMRSLAQGLNSLAQLTFLELVFIDCKQITNDGVESFARGFSSLTQLTHLNLQVSSCKRVTDAVMRSLAKGLNSLAHLTSLNLSFQNCKQITNSGVECLAKELDSLTRLTHLSLVFQSCKKITNAGVKSFAEGLNPLAQLTHLDLDFGWCEQITDDGVDSLAQGLNSLTHLASFNLKFEGCKLITNEGVSTLMSQGLKNLSGLTSLILDFDGCEKITGESVHSLAYKWLKGLSLFPSLIVKSQRLQDVNTPPKKQIFGSSRVALVRGSSNEDKQNFNEAVSPLETPPTFSELTEESQKPSTQDLIEELVSTLGENEEIIADTASTLKVSKIFSEICHLTSLTFDLRKRSTDKLIRNLSTQVLRNLPQLRSLTLDLRECSKITDQGVNDLALYGLKPLINLAYLDLDFYDCKITDKGVKNLACEGLRHLSQLKSFVLDISHCDQVTDEGLISLTWHGLRHLSQLETLDLDLNLRITDKGIDGLTTQGLKYLTQLKFLTLNFALTEITDEGVNNLILRLVKDLPELTSLDLDLDGCLNVNSFTVRNIFKVLYYFGFTKEIYIKNETFRLDDLDLSGQTIKIDFGGGVVKTLKVEESDQSDESNSSDESNGDDEL